MKIFSLILRVLKASFLKFKLKLNFIIFPPPTDFRENLKISKNFQETGASHVQLFHHQVRNAVKNNSENGNINTSVQGYAHKIHSDSSMFSAEELFRTMVTTTPEPEKYCKGRFMYVNVWRSIGDEPIEDNHLAMCDEMSVVKPDDYIYTELHGEGYDILQYYLNASNSHLHRWYYFPQMTKNEAIIFKQWDSDTTKPSRLCFHTAFEDPSAPKDASVRQSIEVRAIVYFPDHAPNTCPEVDTSVDEVTGDQTVDAGVHKILKVVGNINSWPVAALFWIRYNLSRGKTGVKAIAMTLAKDKHGYFGLKSLPKETQEEIATTLMTKTNFEGILRGSFEKVKHRASLKNLNLNFNIYTATFVTALSLAVGWGLCRFLK